MKKIYYSYLLNKERDPIKCLISGTGSLSVLHLSLKAAKKARQEDCYDANNTPGKIVKITLETLKS